MSPEKKILEYIESHGIKQSFVSEKSGIPQSKLSMILNGKTVLNVVDMIKICNALNIEPNYCVDYEKKV